MGTCYYCGEELKKDTDNEPLSTDECSETDVVETKDFDQQYAAFLKKAIAENTCPACGKLNIPYIPEKEKSKRKFKRETADRVVSDVLSRIKNANDNDDYIYRVTKAVLFGSYLNSEKKMLGDLDIALYMELKSTDDDEDKQNIRQYNRDLSCWKTGPMNFIAQFYYGREKLGKYLKGRSPLIEFHDGKAAEDMANETGFPCYIYTGDYKIIYPVG